MNTLLFVTNLIIFLLIYNLKKTNKPFSLINNIIISIIIYMMFLPISYFILHSFHIKLIDSTLNIYNLLIISLLLLMIKKYGIQKTFLEKKEMYTLLILLIITMISMFLLVSFKFNVKFSITDSSAHYLTSSYFAKSDTLVAKIDSAKTQNFGETFQFFFYTNLGTIYKVFPNISTIGQYKIFVCYNFFIMYIIGCLLYIVINKEKKGSTILKQIISTIFMLGYPLYVCLCGFSYWNTGALLFLLLIYLIDNYEIFDKKTHKLLLSLCLFSIFTSYYLFVPIAYFSTFIFLIKQYKNEKVKLSTLFIDMIQVLFIPGLLGFSYFVLPGLIVSANNYIAGVSVEGAILTDVIANYILFIPIVFYYLSSKNDDFINNIYVYNLIYMALLFSLSLCNIVSSYYFSKILYINLILTIILFYRGIIEIKKTNQNFVKIYLCFYAILFIMSLIKIDDSISSKKDEYSNSLIINRLYSVYNYNIQYTFNKKEVFNATDFDFLELSTNYVNTDNEIFTDFKLGQKRWYEALYEKFPTLDYDGYLGEYALDYPIEIWEKKSEKYAIISKERDYYKKFIKKYKVVEESKNFAIISK